MMKSSLLFLSTFVSFSSAARFGFFRVEQVESTRRRMRIGEFGRSPSNHDASAALRELLYMDTMSMSMSFGYEAPTPWPTPVPSASPSMAPSFMPSVDVNGNSTSVTDPTASPGAGGVGTGTNDAPTKAPTVHQFPDTAAPSANDGTIVNLQRGGGSDTGSVMNTGQKTVTVVLLVAAAAVVAALVARKMHKNAQASSQNSVEDSAGDGPQGV